jgi:hypothetical protein
MSIAAIMTEPDFAEICFLVALILFVVHVVIVATKNATEYGGLLISAGLAFVALGWLAL